MKRQREAKARKKPRRKMGQRKNPFFEAYKIPAGVDGKASAFTPSSLFDDVLGDVAGNVLVYSALLGCSFEEKTIIAALIPLVIPILRKHGLSLVEESQCAETPVQRKTETIEV